MADDLLTENDGDDIEFEIVEVAEIPTGAPVVEAKKPAADDKAADDEDDDDADGEEDRRLADDEDDDDSPARKRRRDRRKAQKAARERLEAETRRLRTENAAFQKRLEALEGGQANTNKAITAQKIAEAQAEIDAADRIIAKAVEAGNGDDVVAAQRIRDQARENLDTLKNFEKTLEVPARVEPASSPAAVAFANEWVKANSWYDPAGGDARSVAAKAIDNEVLRDGFTPDTLEYWQELTRRVAVKLFAKKPAPAADDDDEDDDDAPPPRKKAAADPANPPKRKGPPVGQGRNDAPRSTRQQVYVTPERKAALQEAGVWDDPKLRAKYLKSYSEYDRSNQR